MPTFPASLLRSTAMEGDPDDFEPRYEEIIDLAWRTLRRLGVPLDAVPDAAQDALLVLHRRREEFRGQSSYQTWVYGVLLRVASDYRRKHRRKAAVFAVTDASWEERAASEGASPFEQLERRAAAELLLQLLDQLPHEVREIFVLVELEELQIAEAALVLQLRASTCKSRLRIARRSFNAAVARERAKIRHHEGTEP